MNSGGDRHSSMEGFGGGGAEVAQVASTSTLVFPLSYTTYLILRYVS